MLTTLIDAPFDDPDWLFEIKWDGFRALCMIDEDGTIHLTSRNGKDLGPQFPGLAGIAKAFRDAPILVDGEIVALDAHGRSSFQRLQGRMGAKPPPVTFVVFDVLYAGGRDVRDEPLEARKAILEKLVKKGAPGVLYSQHVVGTGNALFEEASRQGLEGIIGKRREAPYVERRTRDWVKIKAQKTQECVIAGWTEPGGARSDFGSLILGVYERGAGKSAKSALLYAGNVGTGFTRESLAMLMKKLRPLAIDHCPFAERPKFESYAGYARPVPE
jgi:bifunctional non-homologous end joining protein LigD